MKTKRKRNHFFLIRGTIYPFDVLITTASFDEVIKYIEHRKHYDLNDEEKEKLNMHGTGRTVMLRGGQTIIRLPLVKTELGIDVSNLVHEIEHATFFLFDRTGIKHSEDSDEAFAYYQSYLMREAMWFFEKQIKPRKI